jgi:uncharacterized membrane protein YuzA (DUF378 family)
VLSAASRRDDNIGRAGSVTLLLVIVGGVNWGLVGLYSFDLVAAIFGAGSPLSWLVYTLVGLSGLWQIVPLTKASDTTSRSR